LQAEVNPSLLVSNHRKFHIRTYVVIVEKLHDDDLVDIYVFNRHEVRIAGQPVDASATNRDRLSHITNGALSDTTERCLVEDMEELKSRGIKEKTEIFVASLFVKHLLSDIRRRISISAQQEPSSASKFAVAGLDLMVTESNRIFLLEVNSNPAAPPAEMVTENFKNHLTGFMHDLVDLVVGQPSPNFLHAKDILKENGLLDTETN
jgi:Tubulin-tyrosine ligase family